MMVQIQQLAVDNARLQRLCDLSASRAQELTRAKSAAERAAAEDRQRFNGLRCQVDDLRAEAERLNVGTARGGTGVAGDGAGVARIATMVLSLETAASPRRRSPRPTKLSAGQEVKRLRVKEVHRRRRGGGEAVARQ